MTIGGCRNQVQGHDPQPAAIDRDVILQGIRPVDAEIALVEAAALAVALGHLFLGHRLAHPAVFHDSSAAHGHRRNKANVKGTWIIFKKAVAAAADQDYVATIRQFPHCLFQGLKVPLINATWPEPLEDAGRLFVDLLQFCLGTPKPAASCSNSSRS